MKRPVAVVSVDVDPVDLHLVGYGFTGLPPDPLVHERALPRLLEAFERHGVRATLFVVGRDVAAHRDVLARAASAGHELASHTWSHPIRFASLPESERRRELADSKAALEAAGGAPVVGFRAPNFDVDARSVPVLASLGYRYDASAYPTPMLIPARAVLALKSADPAGVLKMSPWPFTWRRDPHVWSAGHANVHEFPVAVTPGLRLPVYHTLRYFQGDAAFVKHADGFARRGDTFSYVLHGVDALGMAEDEVDARLAKHPGMDRRLEAKLALLDRTLAAIAARFETRTYRELVG